MRNVSQEALLTNIVGVDGSGKSSTALDAAKILSSIDTGMQVTVTDNDGLRRYRAGELIAHYAPELEKLQPTAQSGRLVQLGRLATFTAARRTINAFHGNIGDLHISVRDPHRIDPALYAGIYGIPYIGKLPAKERLRIFSTLSFAKPAAAVIQLTIDPNLANLKEDRDPDQHESIDHLRRAAEELPQLSLAYSQRFSAHYAQVNGLEAETTGNVVNVLCELLSAARRLS